MCITPDPRVKKSPIGARMGTSAIPIPVEARAMEVPARTVIAAITLPSLNVVAVARLLNRLAEFDPAIQPRSLEIFQVRRSFSTCRIRRQAVLLVQEFSDKFSLFRKRWSFIIVRQKNSLFTGKSMPRSSWTRKVS